MTSGIAQDVINLIDPGNTKNKEMKSKKEIEALIKTIQAEKGEIKQRMNQDMSADYSLATLTRINEICDSKLKLLKWVLT